MYRNIKSSFLKWILRLTGSGMPTIVVIKNYVFDVMKINNYA